MNILFYLIPVFFIISVIYSTIGWGGASSYVAILALLGLNHLLIPKVSLICNIVVVTGGMYFFYKEGHLSFQRAIPFTLGSVPLAFAGGAIQIERDVFLSILSVLLLIVGVRMLIPTKVSEVQNKQYSSRIVWGMSIFIGMILGFVSGLTGLGGGVFLAPILYVMEWGTAKEIAGISSFFIFSNSIAGLIGQFTKGYEIDDFKMIIPLAITVFIGGQIGSRLGSKYFSDVWVKRITAVILIVVSVRILYKLFL